MKVERWDAENYTPYLRAIDVEFSKSPRLIELATVTHASEIPRVYCDEAKSKLFLLAQNIRPFLPDTATTFYIPDQIANAIPINRLEYGDVLVTRSGANSGMACVYMGKSGECYTSGEGLILRSRGNIDGAYIVAFLNSQIGSALCRRAIYGSGQPHIGPKYLEKIPVPRLGKLEAKIAGLVREANALLETSKTYYPEAEAELLDRLGWSKLPKHSPELHYVADFNALEKAERIDAEFFQPQYNRLRKRLSAAGALSLGKFCPILNRGIQPEYVENGDVSVINSKHLGPNHIDYSTLERTSKEAYESEESKKAWVKKFDVLLYSTGAYVGRTNVFLENFKALASNHVAIIRPDWNVCNPTYLALFLNSPVGLAQSVEFSTGSAQRELYPKHIQQFLVFLPTTRAGKIDLEWQKKLAAKVEAANSAKQEAESKLAEAKQLVEQAIKSRNN
ncbi:MAG TPA: restriction endonuclease subunit S [Verrucomicrobiae bacterium]|jgi:restriction endonuclease S subunit